MFFTPLAFGAVGDGVHDDWPAITAATQALIAAGGGVLHFPAGRTFRVGTPGAHGIHLQRQSNIAVVMEPGARLLMDNMVDGLAASHGILVEGPCENIALIGVHVAFPRLSAARQGWAPIYFLGANVGRGDATRHPGWYRGNPNGSEAWQLIEAGAVRNVRLENVTVENSPSVGIGLVGVDGLHGRDINVRTTWADGLYHLYFRNAHIDGYRGVAVGDDGLSLASYESDLAAADIELPFHGEGSTFTNIVLEGRTGDAPAGSIAVLGVRDVVVRGVTVRNRFRGLKLEPGTQATLDHPTLSLNFLANRRVAIHDVTLSGCEQDISFLVKECGRGTDPKWWRHELAISGVTGHGGFAPFDVASAGHLKDGTPALPMVGGVTLHNLTFKGYRSPHTTIAGFIGCRVERLEMDSFLSVQGFVPHGGDPDQLDENGRPRWPDSRSTYSDVKGSTIVLQGLKRDLIERLESIHAPNRGVILASCADVTLRGVRVVRPNQAGEPMDDAAIHIDAHCRRISGSGFEIELAEKDAIALAIDNAAGHWIDDASIRIDRATSDPLPLLISDRRWIEERTAQVGRLRVFHREDALDWLARRLSPPPQEVLHDDADADLLVAEKSSSHRLVFPLTADRTWTLHEGSAAIGDRIEVVRESTATGRYGIAFRGLRTGTVRTIVTIAGGERGRIDSLLIAGAVELLDEPVAWRASDAATAAALATTIDTRSSASGFRANSHAERLTIVAPGASYENAGIEARTAGNFSLSYGFMPRLTGGTSSFATGTSYGIVTTIGDRPFHATFEFSATGWTLLALTYGA